MADSDEYEPCETIWKFLQLKGSVGLLALLYEKPRTYSELESEIEITSSTISRRRIDANHHNLLKTDLESDEHGTKHVYKLTEMGEYLTRQMAHEGITSSYHKMRDHQKTIEEKTEKIADWVEQHPEKLLHFPEGKEGRVAPREDTELPPELEKARAAREDSNEKTSSGSDDVEKSDTDNTDDQTETGGESSDRPLSPSDKIPDDAETSGEEKTQGTFEDIPAGETESSQTDGESDS
ncbi:winged helix-turn-helix domain-containing protein [Halobellus sp. H-GB7]|uniref:winged helix-turn-helix domain-containing protein n=1 Tax=Halobellus sp. H-GB7 TaxID=3069756 RepID=UPI0027B6E776|nr:winged helix-turn-helix domain-containing protein [Halobellus sp. H-GB7]MDQ2055893.1 winged helix-turn-helix domain-containing protein [Halobellus sp. H-GB7]